MMRKVDETMDLHGKNILLIEDDKHIYSLIEAMFEPYEINLKHIEEGNKGLKEALKDKYDLILLDIMLPNKDGWEICRQVSEADITTPVIILTAKVEETDKVLGLEIGADDYVTKPFSPRELIARIKAVLRRSSPVNKQQESKILTFPEIDLKIDINNYNVQYRDTHITLTPKEFELLAFLAQNQKQVFKRKQLLNQIWGFNNYTETRTIDEHIKRIRNKFKKAGLENNPIETIWGVGYKFTTTSKKKNEKKQGG